MYEIAFILFLLLFLALYLTLSSEQKKYDELNDVMEQPAETAPKKRGILWEGMEQGIPVQIKRGMMFRDSSRLITVVVKLSVPFYLQLDPWNPLRSLTRRLAELLSENKRISWGEPLDNFIIYTNSPESARDLLGRLDDQPKVDSLRQFHHLIFSPEHLTAWFYQTDINIPEIKQKTKIFVNLLKESGIEQLASPTND